MLPAYLYESDDGEEEATIEEKDGNTDKPPLPTTATGPTKKVDVDATTKMTSTHLVDWLIEKATIENKAKYSEYELPVKEQIKLDVNLIGSRHLGVAFGTTTELDRNVIPKPSSDMTEGTASESIYANDPWLAMKEKRMSQAAKDNIANSTCLRDSYLIIDEDIPGPGECK